MFNDSLKVFPISVDFVPHCWVGFVVPREAFLQTSKNRSFPLKGSIPQTMALSNPRTKSRERGPWPVRMWPSLVGVGAAINHPIPWLILQLLLLYSMELPEQGLPLLSWYDYSAHRAGFSSYQKSVYLPWYFIHQPGKSWSIWVHLWKIKLPLWSQNQFLSHEAKEQILDDIKQRFDSKCGPWISSISLIWDLLELQFPGPNPRSPESKGWRPAFCFNKHSRGFWCLLKFESHYIEIT